MRAAVVDAQGGSFAIRDVELATPLSHEVLVDVRASGLCHSDLTLVHADLGYPFPAVFGHEVAGIVAAVGDDVTEVRVGQHVVGSLVQFCGKCTNCSGGRTHQCLNPEATVRTENSPSRMTLDGIAINQAFGLGGFAQQALIHENQLAVVPDSVPFAIAALLGCGVITGAGAVLNSAQVEAGDTVVVIGAGGVGLNGISGARIAGASTIVATDISDDKLAMAMKFGATHVVNSATTDPVTAVFDATAGRGADHVFDFVGTRGVTAQALKMLAKGGGLYLIGIGDGDPGVHIDTFPTMMNQNHVAAVYMGSSNIKRDIPLYANLYLQGRMNLDDLVTREISLSQIDSGYESLKDGRTARVVITEFE